MSKSTKKPDRRAQRTRDLLLDALVFLLMEKGYEKLTIQQLLDRAGVGRATFYSHFQSKADLLSCSVERLRTGLIRRWKAAAPAKPHLPERLGFTLPLFQHLDSHRRIYHRTIGPESEVTVQRHLRRMLRGLVLDDLASRTHGNANGSALDLAVHFVEGALWSIVVWWMESETSLSPEQINSLFQRLTFPGLDATLTGTR